MRYKPTRQKADLFNLNFIMRVLLLGVLPYDVWVAWQKINFAQLKRSLWQRGLALCLVWHWLGCLFLLWVKIMPVFS